MKNNFLKVLMALFVVFFILFLPTCVKEKSINDAKTPAQLAAQKRIKTIQTIIYKYNKNLDPLFVRNLSARIFVLAKKHEVEDSVILAILAHESQFDPSAKAKTSNATGLGQIIPKYWKQKYNFETREDLLDWEFNLEVTVQIIKEMEERHGHRKDWISFYYDANQPGRGIYYSQWKRKYNYIKYLLKQGV